jgi:hypothetical protein
VVDDARDLERGFGVKALRGLVLALGSQLLKQGGLVILGVFGWAPAVSCVVELVSIASVPNFYCICKTVKSKEFSILQNGKS